MKLEVVRLCSPSVTEKMGQHLNQDTQVSAQAPQLSAELDSTTKRTQRGLNFTVDEDKLIVSAWLNVSSVAGLGTDEKRTTYWRRIWEHFHQHKNIESDRSESSLMHRWSMIQLGVNKFCRCYDQIESKHQSGVNEEENFFHAKVLYKELHKGYFLFEHCWNLLRHQPKWMEQYNRKKSKKNKIATTCSPSTPESINLGEDDVSLDSYVDLEMPTSRKPEKERVHKRKNKETTTLGLAGALDELAEDAEKMNVKKMGIFDKAYIQEQVRLEYEKERLEYEKERLEYEKEKVRIKRELLRVEQLKEEERIIMMDTSGLSPIQQEYYHQRQTEILEQRGIRVE